MANSLKTILLATVVIFASINSFGAENKTGENCYLAPCRKYKLENSFKAKIRCADYKTIYAESEALLVNDTKCSLVLSRVEKKKKIYYLVLTTADNCEIKLGSEVKMSLRKGGIQKGREGQNPCPNGTIGLKRKEDNPQSVIDGKELEHYVDANVFGISNPHYPY